MNPPSRLALAGLSCAVMAAAAVECSAGGYLAVAGPPMLRFFDPSPPPGAVVVLPPLMPAGTSPKDTSETSFSDGSGATTPTPLAKPATVAGPVEDPGAPSVSQPAETSTQTVAGSSGDPQIAAGDPAFGQLSPQRLIPFFTQREGVTGVAVLPPPITFVPPQPPTKGVSGAAYRVVP